MKLNRLILVVMASVLLTSLLCPGVQADGSETEIEVNAYASAPPSVETWSAWPVGRRWALLHGRLTDMGDASSVGVYFEWGTDTDYGSMTRIRTRTRPGRFMIIVRGLTPSTTYHFRAVAVGDGTSYGIDESFTTRRQWRRR